MFISCTLRFGIGGITEFCLPPQLIRNSELLLDSK